MPFRMAIVARYVSIPREVNKMGSGFGDENEVRVHLEQAVKSRRLSYTGASFHYISLPPPCVSQPNERIFGLKLDRARCLYSK